jgi:NAD(P)-dependent dehydrogenase (short-subunit alcohol dehydrogenase family)
VLEAQSRVEQIAAGRLRRVFETNVYGSFFCAREAVRRMSTRHGGQGGAIVNVSSVAARLGAAGEYVDYAAPMGALDSFTVGLAGEVAGEGIRVNGVRPGFIYTDIHASGGEPGRVDRIAHTLPLGRGGTAEEVANAIVWLASEEASFVTGAILDIAGGR